MKPGKQINPKVNPHSDNVVIGKNGKEEKVRSKRGDGLSDIERLFVAEYCVDLNATRAYMRIRPDTDKRVARQVGYEIKNRAPVLAAINSRLNLKTEWAENAKREVIETLLACLRTTLLDFMRVSKVNSKGGKKIKLVLRDLSKVSPEKMLGLSEVNVKEFNGGSSVRVRPIAKTAILKLLVDVLGMKNEVDPDEEDRNQMNYASRTVARRMSNILVGIEKMAEIRKEDEAGESS